MINIGDVELGKVIYIPFNTFDSDGASVTVTNLANTDVHIHKDGSVDEFGNFGAITVHINFDGITGCHLIEIDTGDSSAVADFEEGSDYKVRLEGITVDSQTLNPWIGMFSIRNRTTGSGPTAAQVRIEMDDNSTKLATLTTGVNLTKIDGQNTNDYNATLKLKKLDIQNSAGSAIVAKSTGSNGHGLEVAGNGSGEGINALGGVDGNGIEAQGGSTSGHGILTEAQTSGQGIRATGKNASAGIIAIGAGSAPGLQCNGGSSGPGIKASGGVSGGAGIQAQATGNNDNGMTLTKDGSGKDIDADEIDDISLVVPDAAGVAATQAEVATELNNYGANTTTPPTVGEIQTEMEENGDSLLDTIRDAISHGTYGLAAIRTRGDAAWITGGGEALSEILNIQDLIPNSVDLANTATVRLALGLTNMLDNMPSTAEIDPGTISIDRKAIGGTSWTNIVSNEACSEVNGMVYYDEVFNADTGYAAGDSIRITFKNQKITVDANDYEVTGSDGWIFQTFVREAMVGTNSANTTTPDASGTAAGLHATTDAKIDTTDGLIGDLKDFDASATPVEIRATGGTAGINAAELVDDIMDENISKSQHNVANSLAKKIRGIEHVTVLHEGQAQGAGGGNNTIELAETASDVNNWYKDDWVMLVEGTGENQMHHIESYVGNTRIATLGENWLVNPDNSTDYVIIAQSSIHVHRFEQEAKDEINVEVDSALSDYGANTVTPDASGTAAGLHGTTDGKVDANKVILDTLNGLIENSGGDRYTEKALEEAPSGAGLTGTQNTALILTRDIMEGDVSIDKTTTPWQLVVKKKSTSTEVLRKDLKDVDGVNIGAITTVIGQQLEP